MTILEVTPNTKTATKKIDTLSQAQSNFQLAVTLAEASLSGLIVVLEPFNLEQRATAETAVPIKQE
ncbi:MAG: hypothetical protein UU93_C0006G0050 [Candidatus Amesbacteria bacterium GW2011_GWA2_42_12]|uniref:Uncharacterized protein n=1 Tax=Candidatus Amesbacteria bacterium GW2011_GWA2_42_12 TaxID=1618356 RepID=A0A0G1AEL4_9BACT|nr:MAG: hypothetical protein UU93_C0006G0050 [Candidatus Amesbacteria bacterium GW2011_GWA2_42_12]